MFRPFQNKQLTSYWLKVFALYALVEALVQLLIYVVLNNFGAKPISIIEMHLLMWFFQCLLIWPIWWVAWSVRKKKVIIQVFVNIAFYILYSYIWFGPVQDAIGYLYDNLQQLTRTEENRLVGALDRGDQSSYLNYQLLKHAFRLSWFYLAAYLYNYRLEEKKRTELALANKELQLKMLKWHLNPSFYFKTINYLRQVADDKPVNATGPILQLAKVMEYVIYEAKEKLIDVKKEIHFLDNYTQLLNRRDSQTLFETEVTGDYGKLKISPLLLAGFIDRIVTENNDDGGNTYQVLLNFSGKEMRMTINKSSGKDDLLPLSPDSDLYRRLTELYPGKFSFSNSIDNRLFKLSMILDEER